MGIFPEDQAGSAEQRSLPRNSEVPQSIFRQELVTWSYTENGVNKTTLVRNFTKEKHIDSFISEPIIFGKDLK